VATGGVTLRPARAADRARVEQFTRNIELFRPDEVPVALEVFDAAVGGDTSYTAIVAEHEGRAAGWACWGATPCTVGTYDMYWLAVDPVLQGAGIGSRLVAEMERRLAGTARLIVVETAGRPDYGPTRAFYEARGYRRTATIPEFYAPDDDLVVYVKRLTSSADSEEDG
jgi:ribosomal protein S18 acetylase RimI-like enzyme